MIDEVVLQAASEALKSHDSWAVFTHRRADGDAIGSASALYQMGKNSNRRMAWYSPDSSLPVGYSFLPCYRRHTTAERYSFDDDGTLYVFLDCANETRGVEGFALGRGINALNIDHHEDNTHYGKINCVDGSASSTCEVLYQVFRYGDWDITASIAKSLYVGIFTDTGGFTFSNTHPLTHRITAELIEQGAKPDKLADFISQNKSAGAFTVWAKAFSRLKTFGEGGMFALSWLYAKDFLSAGANMTETEGLPSTLMGLRGVKLIAMLTENYSGDIRCSFRSRDGSPFGAGEIARIFGGGGHERAAAATLKGTLRECTDRVEAMILQKYHECVSADQ